MIYGDPFTFALQFDVVGSWNAPGDIWKNGMFAIYIDGKRIFSVVDVFELATTLSFYSKSNIEELKENNTLSSASEVFKNAQEYFLGDEEVLIDGLLDLTCTAMEDNCCYLYFLKTSNGDRLVWRSENGGEINNITLPKGNVLNVINQLEQSF